MSGVVPVPGRMVHRLHRVPHRMREYFQCLRGVGSALQGESTIYFSILSTCAEDCCRHFYKLPWLPGHLVLRGFFQSRIVSAGEALESQRHFHQTILYSSWLSNLQRNLSSFLSWRMLFKHCQCNSGSSERLSLSASALNLSSNLA